MLSSAPFLFLFLAFAPLVAGQEICIGSLSSLALNYDPILSESGDSTDINVPTYTSYISIPVDFSKLPLTVEFWTFWVGRSTVLTDPSNVFYIPNLQNQTTFFYGSSSSYMWLTPCNGATPTQGDRLSLPGWYDGATRRAPAGAFRCKYAANNISNIIWSNQRAGYTHTAITVDSTGLASIIVSATGECPDPGCVYQMYNVRLPPLPPTGWMHFGAVPDPAINSELNVRRPASIKITEIRVWNSTKTPAEIATLRSTRIPATWPGLTHYYRFDNLTKANLLTNGTIENAVPSNPVSAVYTNGFIRPQSDSRNLDVTPTPAVPPIDTLIDTCQPLDSFRFPIVGKGTVSTTGENVRTYVVTVAAKTPAGFGKICYGVPDKAYGCTEAAVGQPVNGLGEYNNSFDAVFFPTRSGCGNTVTITFNTSYTLNSGPSVVAQPLNATFTIPSLTMTLTTAASTLMTQGGNITLQGTNLGVPGTIGLDEHVTLTINGATKISTGYVNDLGTEIKVLIPPGAGRGGNVSVGLCGQSWAFRFDYLGPEVHNVTGVNSSVFRIDGVNFGPSNTDVNINDPNYEIYLNGTKVQIVSVDHTTIFVSEGSLVSGTNYTLSVSIYGQITQTSFLFVLCAQECINGGTCVNVNQCSCPPVWLGAACEVAAVCSQNCENGGVCQRLGLLNDPNAVGCVCPPNAPQNAFCTTVDSGNLPYIIGGTVGGAVLLGAIAGAVILFIVFRRPARKAAKDFVPVHKKDFAKIIYGDQLTQSPDRDAGNIKELDNLLQQDMKAAFAISEITQITEADKISKALVVIYQDHGKAIQLLEAFIDQEVETSESAGTLFRSNSMVSKMFKFYSRLIGLPYLYVTVGPEISKLLEEELGLEVDPEKMEEGKDLDEMRWSLMSQSQKILKQVLASENECPSQFRDLFIHLKTSVGARFPANINTTIGGFIFLRFFCPAVSSPEAYGIVDEPPSADCRRLLILITKVLQNLSNDVEFGSKEPYMSKMNDFIQSNRAKLSDFYSRLLKPPTKPPVPCVLPKNIKAVSLAILLAHIKENISRVTDAETRGKLEAII